MSFELEQVLDFLLLIYFNILFKLMRLGPLLFLIYMNDITQDIESDILIFADDTSLFCKGADPSETARILNSDLEKISIW